MEPASGATTVTAPVIGGQKTPDSGCSDPQWHDPGATAPADQVDGLLADARSRGACWDIHAVSTGSGHVPQATAACEERSNTKVEPRKRPVRFPDPRQTAAYFACQVLPAAESAGSKRFLVQLYSVSLPGRWWSHP